MRLFPVALALALGAVAPVAAQTQRLPTVSPAERQVNDLNAAIARQQRSLGAGQQNQFEVNQLRQDFGRQSVSGPPPVGIAPPGRICPPGATGC